MPSQVFLDLAQVQRDPRSVVTVGAFDGVHLGHRQILAALSEQARQRSGTTTVVTFEPHPQLVVKRSGQPALQILTTVEEKIALLQALHVERIVVIPFTQEFSQTPSAVFVRNILVGAIGMQAIVIGHDHSFGRNREGDVATLRQMGGELGFAVHELPPLVSVGVVISSTRIRQALLQGDVARAEELLAAPYRLSARVVRGADRGRQLGFPTANLEPLHPHKLLPARGVYVVNVHLAGQVYGGMMNLGVRPTFEERTRTLEVHLFDFAHAIYGQVCEVAFLHRLRDEMKFATVADLVAQLQRDRYAALQVLAERRWRSVPE